jgi:hypothetical protein
MVNSQRRWSSAPELNRGGTLVHRRLPHTHTQDPGPWSDGSDGRFGRPDGSNDRSDGPIGQTELTDGLDALSRRIGHTGRMDRTDRTNRTDCTDGSDGSDARIGRTDQVCSWMDGWMDGWIDGWMDEWMGGWMDGWIGWIGRIDGQTDRSDGLEIKQAFETNIGRSLQTYCRLGRDLVIAITIIGTKRNRRTILDACFPIMSSGPATVPRFPVTSLLLPLMYPSSAVSAVSLPKMFDCFVEGVIPGFVVASTLPGDGGIYRCLAVHVFHFRTWPCPCGVTLIVVSDS